MRIPVYQDNEPVLNLLEYLNSRMLLTDAFNPSILPVLRPQSLSEKLVVARSGDILTTAFWLEDSYGYAYKKEYDKNQLLVKKIVQFYPPKTIMLDSSGFFRNKVCKYYMEIVRNSVIVPFTQVNFGELKLQAPEAEALANCILAELLDHSNMRRDILDLRGGARYHELIYRYGVQILQCFPQKELATFLDYAPQYLNTLIRKYVKKR